MRLVASLWPLNGTVIKLWVGFWSHSCWLRTKAQGFIAQGEGEAEGGAGVTQNLLLHGQLASSWGQELCRHLQRPPAYVATSEGFTSEGLLELDPRVQF